MIRLLIVVAAVAGCTPKTTVSRPRSAADAVPPSDTSTASEEAPKEEEPPKEEPKDEVSKTENEATLEELVKPPVVGEEEVVVPGMASLEAFQHTLWPLAKQYCGSCHSGSKFVPYHGDAEIGIAHSSIVDGAKVNFAAPIKSRLVQRLLKENHNCWSSCEENGREFEAAIVQWVEKMKPTVIKRPKTVTETETATEVVPPPPPLLHETVTKLFSEAVAEGDILKLKYDLKPLVGVDGVSFEIEVVDFNPTSFKFKNPKIVSDKPVRFSGLQVWINEVYDPLNATYALTGGDIQPPGAVISTAALVALKDNGETDKISIHFDEIAVLP